MKSASRHELCDQTAGFFFFCTFLIDAQHRLMTPCDAPQPHLSHVPCVCKHFHNENGAARLLVIEKMATPGVGNKKIATTLGLNSDREAFASCRSRAQRKTRHLARHLTLHCTIHRHRQHHRHRPRQNLPSRNGLPLPPAPQMAPGPTSASQKF